MKTFVCDTVDGRNPAPGRYIVYPIIYDGFHTCQVVNAGFPNHQEYFHLPLFSLQWSLLKRMSPACAGEWLRLQAQGREGKQTMEPQLGGGGKHLGKHPSLKVFVLNMGYTWRIIPISKWLVTMVSKSPNWGCSPSKWPKWLINGGY